MTDAQRDPLLVVRAHLGDRVALTELVGHRHLPVWRRVRAMLGDRARADDVSQEVWARALRALPLLRQPDRFAPWLLTIARRSVTANITEGYDRNAPAEPPAVLDRTQVSDGPAGLPSREREVLILFYLHDLPVDDCAEILGVRRTRSAFAGLIVIGLSWTVLALWSLRRRPLSAVDRVIGARMVVVFSATTALFSAVLAGPLAGLPGLLLTTGAVILPVRARAWRDRLRSPAAQRGWM